MNNDYSKNYSDRILKRYFPKRDTETWLESIATFLLIILMGAIITWLILMIPHALPIN